MFSMKYESESGFTRLLNLILEKDASDSGLLRPSRAEVGKYYTVFFVYRSINTCLVGEMWLCSTLCINLFLLDNGLCNTRELWRCAQAFFDAYTKC